MKILLDTNVLIDYITKREPFYENAREVIILCTDDKIEACVASHSITNIFYILRKNFSIDERRSIIKWLCEVTAVIGIDKEKIINAVENNSFNDFEDCLQDECAVYFGADYIITRNINDFSVGKVKAITPSEFIDIIKK